MAYDVQEGFWGDAGESIEAYYAVNDFVRAERRQPAPDSRRAVTRQAGQGSAETARAGPGARSRRCRPRRGRGWPGCRRPCPARGTGAGCRGPGWPGRAALPTSTWRVHGVDEEGAGTAVADAVLRGHHQARGGRIGQHGRRRAARRPARPTPWRRCPRRPARRPRSRHGADESCPRRAGRPTRRPRAAGAPRAPCPPRRRPRGGARVFGKRMVEGPGSSSAVRSIGSTSSAAEGANTVMPGMDSASARSRMPWWLGPSSPVMPARSSTKTTGQPCRPTSRLAWSKARLTRRSSTRRPRAQPGHGHAGGGGHLVLLGDADVEEALGEAGLEGEQARSGPGMAAVSATIRGSSSAAASRAREKASV